jgi:YHS domain-containing protein
MERDPICGMNVEVATAKFKAEHQGTNYYFCSQSCLKEFLKQNPGAVDMSRRAGKETTQAARS